MFKLPPEANQRLQELRASYSLVNISGTNIVEARMIDLVTKRTFAVGKATKGDELGAVLDGIEKAKNAERPMTPAEQAMAMQAKDEEIIELKKQLAIATGQPVDEVEVEVKVVTEATAEAPPAAGDEAWDNLSDDDLAQLAEDHLIDDFDPNKRWGRKRKIDTLRAHNVTP